MKSVLRRRAVLTAAVTALAGLAVAPSASAETHAPPVINGSAFELHPEGVAWDPIRRAFLVGSVRHGTVSVVLPDGSVRTLVKDDVMVSTVGVHVDWRRNRVLTPYMDPGVGTKSTLATKGKQSGLGIFDLTTGAKLHHVDLSAVPGASPGTHGANDVAIDADGNAYVTDIGSGDILRVDPDGRASVFVSRPDLLGKDGGGPNGIAWHPDGYLLVVRYDRGAVFRVPVRKPERISEVKLDVPVVGADGIALRPDGSLAVVVNTMAAQRDHEGVAVLRSHDGWTSARQTWLSGPWPEKHPTTAAVTPFGTYVVAGNLAEIFGDKPLSNEFTLRRI
ncbi:SMP-30/gluconolaconase/LRE-like protein [Herbihabitans rhizosphaerae]|uniref:SMP-30/gluconolaconase/LRE-like protein n=2 Tax=Herbihabitans rhizosphaerae TaxID=1872711 RepID=A0A4Q7KR48_9PSEU|nr:SMP-30/gluconolaconase/LRE-like protein [Herbihabitans rhizosphaerae]